MHTDATMTLRAPETRAPDSSPPALEGAVMSRFKVRRMAMLMLCAFGTAYGGDMDLNALLSPVPPEAKLESENYDTWGGSMVCDPEGKHHLFYSRWPRTKGFAAWVTNSEIAHAVADKPTGPYRHVDVTLPARGSKYWNGMCTHNPTIHAFGGKSYLYYMGNTGDGKDTKGLNMIHRNNQRIGVAVADHPNGPWKRFDRPLIDVSQSDEARRMPQ